MNDQQLQIIKTTLPKAIDPAKLTNVFITKDVTIFDITTPKTHGTISLAKKNPNDFYLKLEPQVGSVVSGQSGDLSDLLHQKISVLQTRFAMQNQQPLNFSGLINQSDEQLKDLKEKLAKQMVPNVDNNDSVAYQNDIQLILTQRYNQALLIQLINLFNQFHQNPIDNTTFKNKINKGLYQFVNPFKTGDNQLHQLYQKTQKTIQPVLSPTILHHLIMTEETINGLKSYLDQLNYFDRECFKVKTLQKLDKNEQLNPISMNARNNFKQWVDAVFNFITTTQRALVDEYRTKQPESHDNKMNLGHYYYQNAIKLL